MRSFTIRILANNQAGSWQSWDEKIAAIKAFYASVCQLDITVTPTTLTPQFAPYEPSSGNGVVYRVDQAWYDQNVTPLAQGADIVLFVVPPTDHPNVVTLIGLDYYQQSKVGEISLFVDETSHTYISQNGTDVDQGETAVVYAEHELSHQFYGLLAKTDNTHLYFFAGTPEKVLADFDFDETLLSDYQQLVQTLEQYLGLLKARQTAPNADLIPQNTPQKPVTTTTEPTTAPTPPAADTTLLETFLQAIKTYEGWAPPGVDPDFPNGTPAYQNNNPGNIRCNSVMATLATGCSPAGFCIFPSETIGMQQLRLNTMKLCLGASDEYNATAKAKFNIPNAANLTLQQYFEIRDPSTDDNDPDKYARFVGTELKVDYTVFQMKQLV